MRQPVAAGGGRCEGDEVERRGLHAPDPWSAISTARRAGGRGPAWDLGGVVLGRSHAREVLLGTRDSYVGAIKCHFICRGVDISGLV